MTRPKLSDILELSIAERIELVQEIWDSIAESPEELSFTEDQKKELDTRAAELRSNPSSGSLWEDIKANLKL
jgi:putative addiction module component (TIGR02574 family)